MNTVEQKNQLDGIILAAGRGTRMNAVDRNKVMYEVGGKPMITYPVEALKKMGIARPVVVVCFAKVSIQQYLRDSVRYAEQLEPKGTADAVSAAIPVLSPEAEDVIVLYGDHSTFYTAELLAGLVEYHKKSGADMTLITTHTNPTGYGRILRDDTGRMIGIVEEKNATEEQRKITEINTGNGVYKRSFLDKYLKKIEVNPISGEFYFTDIVSVAVQNGEPIETYVVENELVGMGVNTPEQLAAAEAVMKGLGK